MAAHFTPGHTAAQVCFEISVGTESLFLLADLAHHAALPLKKLTLTFAADLEPATAAEILQPWPPSKCAC